MVYSLLIIGSFLISLFLTKLSIKILTKKNIMDIPNERSLHKKPTPIGGGWVIAGITLISIITLGVYYESFSSTLPIIIAAIILIIASWQDDVKTTNPFLRLGCQVIAIIIALTALPKEALIFNGLFPMWLERVGIFFAWMWFTNLYNFIDGVDGITSSETICICLGIMLLSCFVLIPTNILLLSSVLLGSTFGFLIFNWQPAKIFLGDIGAIFLGFIIGYLLLLLALEGYVIIALLLPLYHLMDSTIVIIKRLCKKEKIWQAHKQHYSYRSVNEMKRSHAMTTTLIITCNLILIILAVLSTVISANYLCLITGIMITYCFMWYLANRK